MKWEYVGNDLSDGVPYEDPLRLCLCDFIDMHRFLWNEQSAVDSSLSYRRAQVSDHTSHIDLARNKDISPDQVNFAPLYSIDRKLIIFYYPYRC